MKFETKLRNYIISNEQKYFVGKTRLFCQANQRILLSHQMIYWADKKISSPQQNHFVRPTEHFSYINRIVLLDYQREPAKKISISTKQFCCTNNNKIILLRQENYFVNYSGLTRKTVFSV